MQKQVRIIIVALLLVGIATVRSTWVQATNPAIIAGDELKGGSGTGRT